MNNKSSSSAKEFVPYKDMVKDNKTLAEFGPVMFGDDYYLKVRVKVFTLLNKEGNEYQRGPCVSLQLFHGKRFLKAISIPNGAQESVVHTIEQACDHIEALNGNHS